MTAKATTEPIQAAAWGHVVIMVSPWWLDRPGGPGPVVDPRAPGGPFKGLVGLRR